MCKLVEKTDWDLIGFIIGSKYRRNVLFSLKENPKTPKQLSQMNDISINHISNILSELNAKGLVECKNPDMKKGRLYSITEKGKELASVLEKIDNF